MRRHAESKSSLLVRLACAALLACLSFTAVAGKSGGNQPPTVTLTSPANGASFTAPASIGLAATAGDPDGTVTRVDFYQGTSLIGTATSAPYTATWSNVAAGSYTLTAKATDNAGAITTSAPVSVSVASATALVITSPVNGAALNMSSALTVSGTFEGPAESTILVDNEQRTRIATFSGSSFTATFPSGSALAAGANTITVKLSRPDRTSATRTITVNGVDMPRVVFIAPSCNTFTAPANITLWADAKAPGGTITQVQFFRGSTLIGTATAPPYHVNWNNVASGTYTITANATSNSGLVGSAQTQIIVQGPNTPPSISITSPASGANFQPPANIPITVNATDPDGTVKQVEYFANATPIGISNVPPFSMTWSNVAAGSYSLTARATDDRSSQTTSAPVNITVTPPNQPPMATLTAPTQGATFIAPATIALSATATDTDGSIAKVDFYQGTTLIGTATSAPYDFTWSNVAAGGYSLTAKATDNLGATGTSAPVNVTVVPNAPPAVTLTAPAAGASYFAPATITLSATASDPDGTIARVDFYQGTTLIATATAPPYTATWSSVSAGSYTLTAQAIDNLGGSSTSSAVAVTVSGIAITSPVSDTTVSSDRVLVIGTANNAPPFAGIRVNGVLAFVDQNGSFYANDVALSSGSNIVTATLSAIDGSTTTHSITVSSTGPAPIRIDASPLEGGTPLAVAFTVTTTGGATFTRADYDFDGDGGIDYTLNAPGGTVVATYSGAPAVRMPMVTVTDSLGRTVQQRFAVLVEANPDLKLRATFNAMLDRLRVGDVNGALTFITPGASAHYSGLFNALQQGGALTAAVNALGTLRGSTVGADIGELILSRDTPSGPQAFPIWLLRGSDGVWRIDSM